MKKLLSLLLAAMLLMAVVPAGAIEAQDYDPVGDSFAAVHAPYLLSGGNSSTTDFLTSADFAANVITIINVWDHQCGPCINEMPYFQQIYDEYASQGVLVVGVATTWIGGTYSGDYNWFTNHGYTYMSVKLDSVISAIASKNSYLPQSFIVDSAGTCIEFIGGSTTYANLKNKVESWLAYYDETAGDHTVTFVDGLTGDVIDTQIVPHRGVPVYPTAPEHEGYNFSGWDPSSVTAVLSDMTITAGYRIKTFSVRFKDRLTDSLIATRTVEYGSAAVAPTPPEHEGYDFVGWSRDFSYVTSNMTVYAEYQEQAQQGLLGDIDLNNELTFSDVSLLYQFVLGGADLEAQAQANSDVDESGEVAFSDVSALYQKLVG